jgi:hypothetical protein
MLAECEHGKDGMAGEDDDDDRQKWSRTGNEDEEGAQLPAHSSDLKQVQ